MDKGYGKPISLPSYGQSHGRRLLRIKNSEIRGEIDVASQRIAKAIEFARNDFDLTRSDCALILPDRKKLVVAGRRDNSVKLRKGAGQIVLKGRAPETWGGGHLCSLPKVPSASADQI